jgi:UDP:flavonoid glycosyltransferase YjiC (YdhE family)
VVHGIGRWLNVEEVVQAGGSRLRNLWAAAELTGNDLSWVNGDLYLDTCPPSLDLPTQRPRPPQTRSLRPVPFDETSTPIPTPPVERGKHPLIHVSLGTISTRVGVLNTILRDLHEIDADIVVTTGNCDPKQLEPQPSRIHIASYIPLTRLLPLCDLVICHGGWGTVIAAAAHGVPVVCVPSGADRPANAQACEAAGMGMTLQPDELQSGQIRATAEAILQGTDYRAAAERVRAEIERMPSPREVVGSMEDLVL